MEATRNLWSPQNARDEKKKKKIGALGFIRATRINSNYSKLHIQLARHEHGRALISDGRGIPEKSIELRKNDVFPMHDACELKLQTIKSFRKP